MWSSCHAQAAGSIEQAVRHGLRIVYHCTLADDEAVDLLTEHRDRLFVAPAAGLPSARIHEAAEFGLEAHQRRAACSPRANQTCDGELDGVSAMA